MSSLVLIDTPSGSTTCAIAEDLVPALQRAFASDLPAVLDCRTRFVPHPAMPALGRMNRFAFDAAARPA